MPKQKFASLVSGGSGRLVRKGRTLPGYYVRFNDDGRQRYRSFEQKRDALAFIRSMNAEYARQRVEGFGVTPFGAASAQFLQACGFLAAETRRSYLTTLTMFGAQVGTDAPVSSIDARHCDNFLSDQQSTESTCAKHYKTLKRFFRWCVNRGLAFSSPVDGVTVVPRTGVRRIQLPTDDDIARLVAAIETEDLRTAAMIGLTTGLDRGMVAGLEAADFDLDAGCLRKIRQKTKRSRPKEMVIPIHQSLIPALRRACVRKPLGPLFPEYARPDWWQRARKAAGAPWTALRVSDFRKIASARLQRVMPLSAVAQILGHSTVETTARHYSPMDPGTARALNDLALPESQ